MAICFHIAVVKIVISFNFSPHPGDSDEALRRPVSRSGQWGRETGAVTRIAEQDERARISQYSESRTSLVKPISPCLDSWHAVVLAKQPSVPDMPGRRRERLHENQTERLIPSCNHATSMPWSGSGPPLSGHLMRLPAFGTSTLATQASGSAAEDDWGWRAACPEATCET
jgi:hypothetical protein